jgi:glycosyltransferase involved in cell wall biosynthesis
LATEIGIPKNRDLCLTNKIFTYIHSGLAIVASDTSAQKQLLQEFDEMGMIYERNNISTLQNIFKTYLTDKNLLIKHKIQAKNYAVESLNWENEKYKFLQVINGANKQ